MNGLERFVDKHPVWSFLALICVTSSAVALVSAARGTPAASPPPKPLQG